MEKPFELKALGNKLLASLKSIAVPATGAVLDWTIESCALVDNGIVKGVGAVVLAVKPAVLTEVTKAVS